MNHLTLIAFLFASICVHAQTKQPLVLPSLIGDNMVLQQNTTIKVWGKAAPGEKISVATSWNVSGDAITNPTGQWETTLKTTKAGGPYTIRLTTKDTAITLKNVMLGEVWFCSGQSNMEMPLAGWPPHDTIMHSRSAITGSANASIRLFIVSKVVMSAPTDDCKGKWMECNPKTIADFSATAYFFGKKLQEKLHIPVGLIESAWGGTPIEAWIPAEPLLRANEFTNEINNLKVAEPNLKKFIAWLQTQPKVIIPVDADSNKWRNLSFNDQECAEPAFNDSSWPISKLPQTIEQAIGDFDGAVWYRRTMDIPEEMTGKSLILSLGPIDDMDRVYINGKLVGSTELPGYWQMNRKYVIPPTAVHAGKNSIAIRVIDNQGGGGFGGGADLMKLYVSDNTSIPPVKLDGDWKFLPVAEFIGNTFYNYDIHTKGFFTVQRTKNISPMGPVVLYNGMVNPVVNYKIKGAIWYQGESNVGRATQYAKLLPLMVQEWRNAWSDQNLSFYVVQIAPYTYSNENGIESAELKNAQAQVLKLKNTGLVVTLDIGVVKNIHPPYKTEVGDRLAYCALVKNYNQKLSYSGPVFKSLKRDNHSLSIQFNFAGGGLVSKNEGLKEFELAGTDGKYYPATATLKGNTVIVSSTAVPQPVSVRYCWRNGAEATLFNKAGLPATLFMESVKR